MRQWESYEEYLEFLEISRMDFMNGKRFQALKDIIAWADQNQVSKDIIPREINKLISLKHLNICNRYFPYCHSIKDFIALIGNLINLTSLSISISSYTKSSYIEIPESIGNLTKLTSLTINSLLISKMPESMKKLTNLRVLTISSDIRNDNRQLLNQMKQENPTLKIM